MSIVTVLSDKRRNVLRVGAAYAIAAFAMIEVGVLEFDTSSYHYLLPDRAVTAERLLRLVPAPGVPQESLFLVP